MDRRLAPLAILILAPLPAAAVDRFEIQVYQADINDPGQLGLEVHLNYTLDGTRDPEFPGQIPPHHVGRLTFEPAVGVTDFLELGAYLQVLLAPGGDARYAGVKLRTKWVLPESLQERLGIPVFLGLNIELSWVPYAVEQDRWANEFRPIIGWKNAWWLVSVNPIVGWSLSGPDKLRLDFEPCAKVAFNTQLGFALGLEYYAGLGLFGEGFAPMRDQEHYLLGVLDMVPPGVRGRGEPAGSPVHESPWEVNLAFGGALTGAPGPHLVAKAILGRSF